MLTFDDYMMAVAAYQAAADSRPDDKITWRQGALVAIRLCIVHSLLVARRCFPLLH